jgi:glycosyltransferase involved in cell wall biosynthesis/uncharacterized coiled-coil protein SlyX
MQIIVLGMHRSGTSIVARLLNMMGAYFAPERVETAPEKSALPITEANPKGYWERWDVLILNENILKALEITWDNIGDFNTKKMTTEIHSQFESSIRDIVVGLDANRPWMVKDPRLCLLLPIWRPVLEIPVCVYVHRSPIQIAQSLKKREGFSLMLGTALWEKYNLHGLANSADMPRILVSHEELMTNPVNAVKKMHQELMDYEVQGLRLPSDKEIQAFIEPQFFREHGNIQLQNAYVNPQQVHLFEAFENGNIFQLEPLPTLSEGAVEILQEYQDKLAVAKEAANLKEDVDKRNQEVVQLEADISKRNEEVTWRDTEIAKRDEEIAKCNVEITKRDDSIKQILQIQKAEIAQYQVQAKNYKNRWFISENQVTLLEQEMAGLEHKKLALHAQLTDTQNTLGEIQNRFAGKEQVLSELNQKTEEQQQNIHQQHHNIHKLTHWIKALDDDVKAVFNSLTWRSGNMFTQIVLKLMFKKEGLTAQDHLEEIIADIAAWQQSQANTIAEPTLLSAPQIDAKPESPEKKTIEVLPYKTILQHDPRDYSRWIKNYDTLTSKTIRQMQQCIKEWKDQPFISIVMPTYNTDEKWLRKAIDSVLQQIYPNWELCIADDASTQPQVRRVLEEYAGRDDRIKLTFRTENGHISAASNTALEMVTGKFVAFLDHDDELSKHALFWVVQDILDYPDTMVWYSDEDKINEQGERCEPYFKPDWNPDLFLSYNYITHLLVYQTVLVRNVGGFREGFEGAQDYDLALRVIEQIPSNKIAHISRILYHWRKIPGSTATKQDEKPYAIIAAQKAISEHLERNNIDAIVTESPTVPGTIRVQYALPTKLPLVSLIIPTHNALDVLRLCIKSILSKTDYPNIEILIVDNNSDDPATLNYLQQLKENEQARILDYSLPFNYPAINNMAVNEAKGEIICLLNNDIEVIGPGWLTEMVSHALRPNIGAVGARLWYPNDTLQHGGVILGIGGVAGHSHKCFPRNQIGYFSRAALIQNFSAVTAACMVLRKETYLAAGGLNAEHLSIAFNDVDFCLKIKKLGLQIIWTPFAELYHHESLSRGHENTPEKIARFQKECAYMKNRWGKTLITDLAYSPNLTLETEDFVYAWPPRVPSLP